MEIKRKHRGSYTVTMRERLMPGGDCVVATIMRAYVPEQGRVMWRLTSGDTSLYEPTLERAKALARDILARGPHEDARSLVYAIAATDDR